VSDAAFSDSIAISSSLNPRAVCRGFGGSASSPTKRWCAAPRHRRCGVAPVV